MHTHIFADRRDDDSGGTLRTSMNIGGAFDGDVRISRRDSEGAIVGEISVPYWQLRALVAEEVRARRIASIEQQEAEQILGLAPGG